MLRSKSTIYFVGVLFCFAILFDYGNSQTTFKSEDLLLLFDRPREPSFAPKGEQQREFDVPMSYFTDEFKPVFSAWSQRMGEGTENLIPVDNLDIPSEMIDIEQGLGLDEVFSLYIPAHSTLASQLIKIFMDQSSVENLNSVAVYATGRVNPSLLIYALSVALVNRDDTQNLLIPSLINNFPDKFVENRVLSKLRALSPGVPKEERKPVEIPVDYTASSLEEEHRLAYFREDTGANLHHYHWHVIYPGDVPYEIKHHDRRGELFYYMHHQIITRYNTERLCHNMKMVERLIDMTQPIKEGYFPKIVAESPWSGRSANLRLQNLKKRVNEHNRVVVNPIDLEDLRRWSDRIVNAIQSRKIQTADNNEIFLDDFNGINILADLIEPSNKSLNRPYYGELHNSGHNVISYIHDPDHRHLENPCVMSETATAFRDPVFYRWHSYIDDIFKKFKNTLTPYNQDQLNYPGVNVTGVQVQTEDGEPNELQTYWEKFVVEVTSGLSGASRDPAQVMFTHLQNKEFTYTINVTSTAAREGTCRIFLASKFDESGRPFRLEDQTTMFIELDRFRVKLDEGDNYITRQSTDSSVTVAYEMNYTNSSKNATGNTFCRCGWPQNLLIPKGNAQGFPVQLFVMISNIEGDLVEQNDEDYNGECKDAQSYCGLKGRLYPDARSMGYPFDRPPRPRVATLEQFLTPNMKIQDVIIRHENEVRK